MPEARGGRFGVLLAGGGGTRLWPASRRGRPKQFLALGRREGEPLVAGAARRLAEPAGGRDRLLVVTAADQAESVRAALPGVPADNIITEPVGRDTAAAVGLAAAFAEHRDPRAIVGAIPADQDIADDARFGELAGEAFAVAGQRDAIVLLGITPSRPETGFGYIEIGDEVSGSARAVVRFVEKPGPEDAARMASSGRHLWNAGMFFAPARRIREAIASHLPETAAGLARVAEALAAGGEGAGAARAREVYAELPRVSFDRGVLERERGALAIPADVGWSDVGSWSALAETRDPDDAENVAEGNAILIDARRNIVVGDADHAIGVVGLDDVVVVQSGRGILVIPRDRAQEVRRVVEALEGQDLDEFLD